MVDDSKQYYGNRNEEEKTVLEFHAIPQGYRTRYDDEEDDADKPRVGDLRDVYRWAPEFRN